MTPEEKQKAFDYMETLFLDKSFWEDGKFRWLELMLKMFKYFNVKDWKNIKQHNCIMEFRKTKEGLDGYDKYYDYYGNSLLNTSNLINSALDKLKTKTLKQ